MNIPRDQEPERMPAVFVGHGNPMNALMHNRYTEAWLRIGEEVPKPVAVLAVSAHWYRPGVAVTATPQPRTIHDFGAFPRELFEFQYPAPGSPALAERIATLLEPIEVSLDQEWGLDHGVWSVLCHMFPDADVPVVQLAIDRTQPPRFHYELGRRLRPLRNEGVLIVATGNIVHNLRTYTWDQEGGPGYDWAGRYDTQISNAIAAGAHETLIEYAQLPEAALAVPTVEHYLPLLYVLGLQDEGEQASFPVDGMEGGSISMTSVRIG